MSGADGSPAETQQDDERPDPLTVWRRGYRAGVKDARERIRLGHDEPVALAARPSADTEKLRRVRELAEHYDGVLAERGPDTAARIRAALDAR